MKKKIENILLDNISGIDLTSTALVDEGYITSLAVIQLVAELDDAFDIVISYQSITKENFNSVAAIQRMVQSYLPQ